MGTSKRLRKRPMKQLSPELLAKLAKELLEIATGADMLAVKCQEAVKLLPTHSDSRDELNARVDNLMQFAVKCKGEAKQARLKAEEAVAKEKAQKDADDE